MGHGDQDTVTTTKLLIANLTINSKPLSPLYVIQLTLQLLSNHVHKLSQIHQCTPKSLFP